MHTSLPLDKGNGAQDSIPASLTAELGFRVVICEDHEVTRVGLRNICTKLGYQVIAETASGAEAIEWVEEYQPDLLLLDLHLRDDIAGQTVHAEIKKRCVTTKIFVITSYYASANFFSWITGQDGPDGVLEKEASVYEIRNALTQVLTTNTKYIPDRILHHEHAESNNPEGINPLSKLAPYQLAVLRDVAQGLRLVDIAGKRKLSPTTVRSYMNDIYSRLELEHHTLQAAAAAYNKWSGTST